MLLNDQKEKPSLDESRKKTDEPVPDVEEISDEEQEVETKEDEEVDGKSADDEEENVLFISLPFL